METETQFNLNLFALCNVNVSQLPLSESYLKIFPNFQLGLRFMI